MAEHELKLSRIKESEIDSIRDFLNELGLELLAKQQEHEAADSTEIVPTNV